MDGMRESEALGSVLVVDDDADIARLIVRTLDAEGLAVTSAGSSEEALAAFARGAFDLVILDVMMPGTDGLELCGRLRAISDVTILFLSARSEELDQLVGFALGADDYLAKPFKPRELAARVKARLRRIRGQGRGGVGAAMRYEVGDLVIDVRTHEAKQAGRPLALTPKEFDILALLARHPGEPIGARRLFEEIWQLPYDASAANVVMVHIRHLRQKMGEIEGVGTSIQTVWGVGYKLVEGA